MEIVFTRQKTRTGANPESPTITQPGTNIRDVRNPIWPVFKWKQNDLFIKKNLQYSQEEKIYELYYHVLGLNESSAEDYMKKTIGLWLFDFTLTKIGIHKFLI